jgi:hypothetical protein
MSTAVGAAGYDPITYPSYWTEISPANSGTAIAQYNPSSSYAVGEQVIYQNRFFLCSSGAGAYANPIDYSYLWTEISPDTVGLTDAPSDNNLYARMNGGWYIVSGGSGGGGTWGSITGTLSNQTDLSEALALKAPLESPALTGIPTAPTATSTDESTQIATTAFVHSAVAGATVSSATAVLATVRNETGSTLTAGTVVYISGAAGNKALVSKSQANVEATSAGTYGLIQNDINNNNNGTAVIAGIITGLNTDAYPDGTKLYLSPTTAGEWTSTKPSAPDHLVYIGVVTRQHANQGTIQLRIQNGFELDELHNVAISASPTDGDVLTYNTTTELWENQAPSGGGVTLTDLGNGDATAGGLVLDALQGSLAPSSTNPMATSGYVTSQINSNNAAISSKLLPAGGTTGQVLRKASSSNYDFTYASGTGCDIQTFGDASTSGTFTWTKPAGAKIVEILLWGAGSGGGAGARYATTSARGGGGGGAAGTMLRYVVGADALGSTETVVIAAGTTGAASIAVDSTNGGTANAGGVTTFAFFKAQGGNQPTGGTNGAGGSAGGGLSSIYLNSSASAGSGAAGTLTNGTSVTTQNLGISIYPTGGGGGAGAAANGTTNVAGGTGGGYGTSAFTGISVAVAGGSGGTALGVAATAGTSQGNNYYQGGTGGGGGFYRTGVAGGAGGAGGFPAGGGGGGGASDNGFASGAGGRGGNGYAVIITYF